MSLHLVVPGLLAPWPEERLELSSTRSRNIEILLARADKRPAPVDYPRTLFSLFGLNYPELAALPTASLCWLADSDQPPPHNLMHADPVHLRADMDRVLLFDPGSIEEKEAAEIVDTFNSHFRDDGLTLYALTPGRWYISSSRPTQVSTQPVEVVTGRNIDPFLPEGQDAKFWMQIFTELQMLFHGLPLNLERQRCGRLPVNGIWFNGPGDVPQIGNHNIGLVDGDDPLLNGLVKASLVQGRTETGEGDQLQVFNGFQQAIKDADYAAWQRTLESFDKKLEGLMNNPGLLVLYPCNGVAYYWRHSRRLFFWRRVKSMGSAGE